MKRPARRQAADAGHGVRPPPLQGTAPSPPPGAIRALLPVRFFFGATFLYAGFDKLLDPRFFDPSSAASIQSQLAIFARSSPIAPLVRIGQPFAVPIGVAIAVAEIAIGLGALTGLAFRLAAWSGALLSILFFLTASWTTRPFYYGPDLPYAAGWIALALAGHGGQVVASRLLDWASGIASADDARRPRDRGDGGRRSGPSGTGHQVDDGSDLPLRDRRQVLQAAVLGGLAVLAASVAIPFRATAAAAPEDRPADEATGEPAGGSPASSAQAGGLLVARVSDLAKTGARAFTVPFSAPAPLPAGDPAVVVQLADGSFAAFDAVCTHAGCTVHWDRQDRVLLCPCHGAAFDPEADGAVLDGPTNQPLATLPILVDQATGAINLRI